MRILVLTCLIGLLAACAMTPTIYGPAASVDATGYRETRIERGRYRISFKANSDLNAAEVEGLALRRAAELTLSDGGEWFRLVSRDTERSGSPAGGTSVGLGGSTGSRGSSLGVGVGINLSPNSQKYQSIIEVLIGTGEKPVEARVYDAQSIIDSTPAPGATP